MKHLKVKLWDREIGRLVWEESTRRTYFIFNSESTEEIPDIMPLAAPASKRNMHIPIYCDDRPLYQGLPPFVADSLPDSWGNTLFDKWVSDNKIPRSKVTPLYKLMFIGQRGMGALEFEPSDDNLSHIRKVDIKSLYDLSLAVLENRENSCLAPNHAITMQALLSVGTSAGGRQMKAIIAINKETGDIRSGQISGLNGYDYYILKFGDKTMPIAEIEMLYYSMAKDAGIEIEDSKLMKVDGINHFLTKRFDRKDGKKIMTQTLAAIYPDARSYEDLIAVCRELSMNDSEISEVYRRMVFNVLANNTDDHNKNFSFIMSDDGRWHLSPNYDVTFTFNNFGTGPNLHHRFSILGKTYGISKSDLIEFAKRNDIKNASKIVDEIASVLSNYSQYANMHNITRPWRDIIGKALLDNLISFGYQDETAESDSLKIGKHDIESLTINVNTKGHYDAIAVIDGNRRRRIIRNSTPEYEKLNEFEIYNLTSNEKKEIATILFLST